MRVKLITTALLAAITLSRVLVAEPAQAGPGGALYLDCTNYVTVPDNDRLTFTNGFTWEAWVDVTKTNWPFLEEWATIFAKDRFTAEDWFSTYNNGAFDIRFDNQAFTQPPQDSLAGIALRTWQHVAVTWDGANVRSYVNGVPIQTNAFSGSIANTAAPLIIGRDMQQGYHFVGYMEELRLWNVARSQSQIASNMKRSLSGSESGLVAYWRFDNSTTNSATLTGASCDGTAYTAAVFAPSGAPFVPDATTAAASGIGLTGAMLNGTVNPGNLATAAWFAWGVDTTYGNVTDVTNLPATNAIFAVTNLLGSLTPGQTYHYQLVATNSAGTVTGADVAWTNSSMTNTVTSLNDDGGSGTLRQVLANSSDGQTIVFGVNGTITLTSGELVITNSLTIIGPGATNLAISGGQSSRVFNISTANAVVTISDVTICNGQAANGSAGGDHIYASLGGTGASGRDGGGIYNLGELTLSRCVLSNNVAGAGGSGGAGISGDDGGNGGPGGSGGSGGGVYNAGALWVRSSTLVANATGAGGGGGGGGSGFGAGTGGFGGGGGPGGNGGGVYNAGALSVLSSTLVSNWTGPGGFGGSGGSGRIVGGNGGPGGSGGNGGGVYSTGTLSVHSSTVVANATGAGGSGGSGFYASPGIYCGSGGNGGAGGNGAGIFNSNNVAFAILHNSLAALNTVGFGGAGGPGFVSGNVYDTFDFSFGLAGSTGSDPDVSGAFTSPGHNLVRLTGNSTGLVNGINNDLVGTMAAPIDPVLGQLTNNGGRTPTIALLPGSPAIDAGDDSLAGGTDQRGFPRLSGLHVDIGAYELNAASLGYAAPGVTSATCVVSNLASGLSSATFSFGVNPNGINTTAWIDYGVSTSYGGTSSTLAMGYTNVSVATNLTLTGLLPGATVHYRVNASSPTGTSTGTDQTFTTTPAGDLAGAGVVSASDYDMVLSNYLNGGGVISAAQYGNVLSNYLAHSQWLALTNVAGLGGTNVIFGLTNNLTGSFTVQYSTNLVDWQPLGPATPRYEFTDTNAPVTPQTYYRLRWP